MIPPPQRLRDSAFSLNCALALFINVSSSCWSSLRTEVMATHEALFLCTSCPRRPLPLMMQYGTSFFLHKAGSQRTSSTGSTSCAMMTSFAALSSTRVVTWFKPYLSTCGFFVFTSSPAFFCCAISSTRCFLASLVSGWYFLQSLRTCAAWFLSIDMLNWLMAGYLEAHQHDF